VSIKAIETEYNGYRFRSRLEARWAVFFDALGIEYEYEPEGFDLEPYGYYLPDFHLTELDCWVEVKPEMPDLRQPGIEAAEKCHRLAVTINEVVLLLTGGFGYNGDGTVDGEGPYVYEHEVAVFVPDMLLNYYEGTSPTGITSHVSVQAPWCPVTEEFYCLSSRLYGFIYKQYQEHPSWFSKPMPTRGDTESLIAADRVYWENEYGGEHPTWLYGINQGGLVLDRYSDWHAYPLLNLKWDHAASWGIHQGTHQALLAARQARFEHGQVGAPNDW